MQLCDVYMLVLYVATAIGLLRLRQADVPMRIFCGLLLLTALTESIAIWCAKHYHNNMAVYAFFNPLQLALVAIYFNSLTEGFRKRRLGLIIGAAGVLLAAANARWLQPLEVMNSNFLLLDGLVTICMALFYIMQLMLAYRPGQSMLRNPHFWVSMSLVFFWAATFCTWGLSDYLMVADKSLYTALTTTMLAANMITYGSFALILILYPKLQPQYA